MTRGLFFGSTTGSQSHSKYLVEFRAGKMTLNGKMVHPDKRKGTVYLHQSEDSLMHFCWKDRTSGTLEDDLIIFPDDAEFKRVTQCTTGRVYVLKFKSSSRRCFYWMQEPKEDKDEELVRKVNEYLNNPPVPGSSRAGGGGGAGGGGSGGHLHSELSNIGDDDLQNLLNNMSQNQLVQLLGGIGGMSGVANLSSLLGGVRSASQSGGGGGGGSGGSAAAASDSTATTTATSATSSAPALSTSSAAAAPAAASESTKAATPAAATTGGSTTTPSAAATTAAGGSGGSGSTTPGAAIQLSDLQNILSGIKMPAEQAGAEAGKEASVNVDLSSAITAEVLQPLLSNRDLMQRVESLLPPPASESGSRPDALSMFSTALQSGQLGPLMQQFGMEENVVAAAASGDMGAFVKALQASKKAGEQGSPKKKKEDSGDEDMGVD
ncbi:regulatory particle non-ATPase 13 isoform X2 [Haemaphysalis longicornis]